MTLIVLMDLNQSRNALIDDCVKNAHLIELSFQSGILKRPQGITTVHDHGVVLYYIVGWPDTHIIVSLHIISTICL